MEGFSAAFLTSFGANFASGVLLASPRGVRRWLEDGQRQQVLADCASVAITAMLAEAGIALADHRRYLERLFKKALIDDRELREELGRYFERMLHGGALEVEGVIELLEEAGYGYHHLPGFDLAAGLGTFETAFLTLADRQPVLQGELISFHTRRQTVIQEAILEELRRMGGQLAEASDAGAARIVEMLRLLLDRQAPVHSGPRLEAGSVAAQNVVVGTQVIQPPPIDNAAQEARRSYLTSLRRQCCALPLAELSLGDGGSDEVSLEQVYIKLDTESSRPVTEQEKKDPQWKYRSNRPIPVLEAAAAVRRLVLLGDPGSGKSSFVRYLAARLAAAQLGSGEAPAGLEPDLLPLLVVLRDLLPRLTAEGLEALPAEHRRQRLAEALREHLHAELKRHRAEGFAAELDRSLTSGRCLLVLDGLDEVPVAHRPRVVQAVSAVLRELEPWRLIVTCRV